jgi:putative heme-binding domain-containing protein
VLIQALLIAANRDEPIERRLEYLALAEFAPFSDRQDILFSLLDTREAGSIQKEAIEQLSRVRHTEVGVRLIANWKTSGPETRTAAGNILLYQPANHDILLTALEQGELKLGELNLHLERRRVLLWSEDLLVKSRAEALFTDAGVSTRKEAMEKMKSALELEGDVTAGKTIFTSLCGQCHRVGIDGVNVGPDLAEIFRKSKESIMHDIIDPNAGCDTEYLSHTVEGEIINGIIADETDHAITLRSIGGIERTVTREQIKRLSSSGLSLMPEVLEGLMDHQQMADLLVFLQHR